MIWPAISLPLHFEQGDWELIFILIAVMCFLYYNLWRGKVSKKDLSEIISSCNQAHTTELSDVKKDVRMILRMMLGENQFEKYLNLREQEKEEEKDGNLQRTKRPGI